MVSGALGGICNVADFWKAVQCALDHSLPRLLILALIATGKGRNVAWYGISTFPSEGIGFAARIRANVLFHEAGKVSSAIS